MVYFLGYTYNPNAVSIRQRLHKLAATSSKQKLTAAKHTEKRTYTHSYQSISQSLVALSSLYLSQFFLFLQCAPTLGRVRQHEVWPPFLISPSPISYSRISSSCPSPSLLKKQHRPISPDLLLQHLLWLCLCHQRIQYAGG
jgi:hypothetical protein